MSQLSGQLGPETLKSIRDFWFQHLTEDSQRILPGMPNMMRWFSQSDEFDSACATKFRVILELIHHLNPTPSSLISAANPQTAHDWLSLIILLDQFPRNIYRGPSSSIVFTFFDPIALSIALSALSKGVDKDPAIRYRLGERMWFYLPLSHSEDKAMQARCVEEDRAVVDLVKRLDESKIPHDLPEQSKNDMKFLLGKKNDGTAMKFVDGFATFAEKHQEIIERFGRFPHRNGPLGREPTAEEVKYLEDGGETFSRKADS